MIMIRHQQMDLFTLERRRQFIITMCSYLRGQFQDELWGVTQSELYRNVDTALIHAARYGLHSERDCCRYLNLAVIYGWEFDRQENFAWMRKILTDVGVSSPSQRLHRLVDQCIYRSEVEESNRRVRRNYKVVVNGTDRDDVLHVDEMQMPDN